jgi:glycosyltransferase involved in cell wall biosynthesis
VTFLGFRRDAPRLLAAFDVFVHPSLWEGLSISLMEAMVAGCPIVCSRIPGNIEMIEDGRTGIFSEPAAPESIVAGVNRMLADPAAARQMAETAQREGMERFPVERMVRENVAAYDSVLPPRKQPIPINRKREDLAA